jgi:hypothetical protein
VNHALVLVFQRPGQLQYSALGHLPQVPKGEGGYPAHLGIGVLEHVGQDRDGIGGGAAHASQGHGGLTFLGRVAALQVFQQFGDLLGVGLVVRPQGAGWKRWDQQQSQCEQVEPFHGLVPFRMGLQCPGVRFLRRARRGS